MVFCFLLNFALFILLYCNTKKGRIERLIRYSLKMRFDYADFVQLKSVQDNGFSLALFAAGAAFDTLVIIDVCMHIFNRNGFCRTVPCAHAAGDTACCTFLHGLRAFGCRRTCYRKHGIIRNEFD